MAFYIFFALSSLLINLVTYNVTVQYSLSLLSTNHQISALGSLSVWQIDWSLGKPQNWSIPGYYTNTHNSGENINTFRNPNQFYGQKKLSHHFIDFNCVSQRCCLSRWNKGWRWWWRWWWHANKKYASKIKSTYIEKYLTSKYTIK